MKETVLIGGVDYTLTDPVARLIYAKMPDERIQRSVINVVLKALYDLPTDAETAQIKRTDLYSGPTWNETREANFELIKGAVKARLNLMVSSIVEHCGDDLKPLVTGAYAFDVEARDNEAANAIGQMFVEKVDAHVKQFGFEIVG